MPSDGYAWSNDCNEKDLHRLLVMDQVNDGETSSFEGLPMPHVTMQGCPKLFGAGSLASFALVIGHCLDKLYLNYDIT